MRLLRSGTFHEDRIHDKLSKHAYEETIQGDTRFR